MGIRQSKKGVLSQKIAISEMVDRSDRSFNELDIRTAELMKMGLPTLEKMFKKRFR